MCDVHSDFYRHTTPVAQFVHRCDECYFPILRGEKHVAMSAKFDGEVATWRAHILCDLLASRISVDDGCRIYGELLEAGTNGNLTPIEARWFESLTGRSLEDEAAL